MKKLNLAFAILVAAVMAGNAAANDPVYSDTVGYMNLTIPAGKASMVSFTLGKDPIISGVFSGKSANTLTTASSLSSLPSNLLNSDNAPLYYIELTSGSYKGLILEITSKASATLTVSDASNVLGNETFSIKKFTTIADIFGSSNSAGLLSGDSVSVADVIWLISGGVWKQYFFYDDGLETPQWVTLGSQGDKGDAIIDPDQGALIIRKEGSDRSVIITGTVKKTPSFVPFIGGAQIVTNPYPVDKTLNTLGLRTGDSSTGLLEGDSISSSDVVWKLNNGIWTQYFFYNDGLEVPQWVTAGSPADQGGVAVSAGEALLVIRKGVSGFTWNPLPPANL
jgi:uncharacterized protein (TIGR02597 family)